MQVLYVYLAKSSASTTRRELRAKIPNMWPEGGNYGTYTILCFYEDLGIPTDSLSLSINERSLQIQSVNVYNNYGRFHYGYTPLLTSN